jgi:uncharacterized damage-inducible protein DinB
MNDIALAWNANTAINDVLLEHLTPAMLNAVTPAGGQTVAQHLTHMVDCLKYWAGELEVGAANNLPDISTVPLEAGSDLSHIQSVMKETYDAVFATALSAKDKGNLPHATVGKFLMYTVAHDSHHRGQILLALKWNGYALPNEAAMWSPWNS